MSATTPQTDMLERYTVHISQFDGPIDLLWHCIRKQQIEIFEIAIAEITQSYMQFLSQYQEYPTAQLVEFYYIASQLLYLKSQRLLGNQRDEQEIEIEDTLIEQLIEFQRLKQLAHNLHQSLARDQRVFARENNLRIVAKLYKSATSDGWGHAKPQNPKKLYAAMLGVVQKQRIRRILPSHIQYPIEEMKERVVQSINNGSISLHALITDDNREAQLCASILALLLLNSEGVITLLQRYPFHVITILQRVAKR